MAIKRIDARLDERGRQRFAREGRVMSALSNHPNVVPVYGVGVDEHGPYLVMPYLSRGSLADRVAHGPMPWDEAVRVMIRLAGAVESAHRGGVIHRDIKPANVLLSDFGEPQLTDFGIARMSGEWATTDGTVTGSLPYSAPELLAGEEPTVASDVYALAATMHQLLTGRPPFVRDDDSSIWHVYHRVVNNPVPAVPGAPDGVSALLRASMAKLPQPRPPSAAAFGQALQTCQHATGLPVTDMAVLGDAGAPSRSGTPLATTTGPAAGTGPRRSVPVPLLAAASAVIAVAVIALAIAAVVRLRGADGEPGGPASASPIDLPTGDGAPADPAATAGERDLTPDGRPAPLSEAGTTVAVRLDAYSNARLRFRGEPGQRALARVKLVRGEAESATLRIERDRQPLARSTFWGGPENTVGPARIGATGDHSATIASGNQPLDIELTVLLAPPDATAQATVGRQATRVQVSRPYQTAVIRFAGQAGQKVTGRWQGPSITDTVDLVMRDPSGEPLTDWSGSDDDRSDEVTLPVTGTYTVEVRFNEAETGDGRLTIEPA